MRPGVETIRVRPPAPVLGHLSVDRAVGPDLLEAHRREPPGGDADHHGRVQRDALGLVPRLDAEARGGARRHQRRGSSGMTTRCRAGERARGKERGQCGTADEEPCGGRPRTEEHR